MPQKMIPAKPGGTVISDNIQRNGEIANANPLTSALSNELLPQVDTAIEDLSNLGTSLRVLIDLAERAHRSVPFGPDSANICQPLTQLCVLARMMEYIAFDTSNSVDCALERFRENAAEMGVKV